LQVPLTQLTPAGHAFPQAPQLLAFDISLTQSVGSTAGQAVSGALQLSVQVLPLQAEFPVPMVAGMGQAAVHEVPQ
jgi:hypothetical protein